MKKFSIIMISYQCKKFLQNALEALHHQKGYSREDYEVILVDDGSSDDSHAFVRFTNKNFYFKYIHLERCPESCISRARNYGFRNADGEFIVFMDADIIVRENFLSELDRYFSADKELLVTGPRLMLQDEVPYAEVCDKSVYNKYTFDPQRPELFELRDMAFQYFSYNASAYRYPWLVIFGCNMAMHRKWLEKFGGFDETFKGWGVEDSEMCYRLHREGIKSVINSKLEVLHQYHGNHRVVDESKYPQIERNIHYLYEKYPDLEIPRDELCDLFEEKAKIHLGLDEAGGLKRHVIEFKDKALLQDVKDRITGLSDQTGNEIIVLDYVETAGLDIWIQLLGQRNSTPLYFPVSRKMNVR